MAAEAEVIWETPPDPMQYSGGKYGVFDLDTLKKRPGQWARVSEHRSANAARAAMRRIRGRAAPGFEFTVRTVEQGGGNLYGRYVGAEGEHWTQETHLSTAFSEGTKIG